MSDEFTFLIGVTAIGNNAEHAHHKVMESLTTIPLVATGDGVTSWWVAEDKRQDRSDCDSGVFVTPGLQDVATRLLHAAGLTPSHNVVGPGGADVDKALIHHLRTALNAILEPLTVEEIPSDDRPGFEDYYVPEICPHGVDVNTDVCPACSPPWMAK